MFCLGMRQNPVFLGTLWPAPLMRVWLVCALGVWLAFGFVTVGITYPKERAAAQPACPQYGTKVCGKSPPLSPFYCADLARPEEKGSPAKARVGALLMRVWRIHTLGVWLAFGFVTVGITYPKECAAAQPACLQYGTKVCGKSRPLPPFYCADLARPEEKGSPAKARVGALLMRVWRIHTLGVWLAFGFVTVGITYPKECAEAQPTCLQYGTKVCGKRPPLPPFFRGRFASFFVCYSSFACLFSSPIFTSSTWFITTASFR